MTHTYASKKPRNEFGQVRIIAGLWRGRKLKVLDCDELRPTPDRVRETLFNWLQAELPGSCCLDLFAGSGALGFEAASRGAKKVLMIEQAVSTVSVLHENIQMLEANQIQVNNTDAINWLGTTKCDQQYDIVFVDPPYRSGPVEHCCRLLENRQWLANHAKIYVEVNSRDEVGQLPENWQCLKSKKAGQVSYHLYTRQVR